MFEQYLYGADVVDAYMDLAQSRLIVQRRYHTATPRLQVRLAYLWLRVADQGGLKFDGDIPA